MSKMSQEPLIPKATTTAKVKETSLADSVLSWLSSLKLIPHNPEAKPEKNKDYSAQQQKIDEEMEIDRSYFKRDY